MDEFAKACKELDISLRVLLHAKPTCNEKIERSNQVFREEFYADLTENSMSEPAENS